MPIKPEGELVESEAGSLREDSASRAIDTKERDISREVPIRRGQQRTFYRCIANLLRQLASVANISQQGEKIGR